MTICITIKQQTEDQNDLDITSVLYNFMYTCNVYGLHL